MQLCHFGYGMTPVDPDCKKPPKQTDDYAQNGGNGRESLKGSGWDRNADAGRYQVVLTERGEIEDKIHDGRNESKFIDPSVHEIEEGEQHGGEAESYLSVGPVLSFEVVEIVISIAADILHPVLYRNSVDLLIRIELLGAAVDG